MPFGGVAGHVAICLFCEKLAEQKRLLLQSLGVFVVREQVDHFIAEDGNAARLQADDRHARLDFWPQRSRIAVSRRLAVVEHAEIVEGPTAA